MELILIVNAVPEIDRVALQDELISFASSYKDLKKRLLEKMNDNENDSDRLDSEEDVDNLLKPYYIFFRLHATLNNFFDYIK